VVILRIKQAECALADGRLDEAFDILKAEQVRRHRRGQALAGRLTRALAVRGRSHLDAGRIEQALNDCNKADKLGGNLAEITELREAICHAIALKQQNHNRRSRKLACAREHIDNGWLSAGERILAGSVCGGGADELREEAAAMRLQVEAAVAKAEEALGRNDLEAAVAILKKTDPAHRQNSGLRAAIARTTALGRERIVEHLNNGRGDPAHSVLKVIEPLGSGSVEFTELAGTVNQCLRAAELAAAEPRKALRILERLKTLLPAATWINDAVAQARQAAEALEALAAGPLGLLACGRADSGELADGGEQGDELPGVVRDAEKRYFAAGQLLETAAGTRLPSEFVLQIDGVGSFLVLQDDSVTVGPISSSARPVLGLLTDPHTPAATIERTDGDYFIRSQDPIHVNDRPATEKLLDDGDTIALSERCRLRFGLPNAASTTATLVLSTGRFPRADINRVILVDKDILVGPGASNHIRADRCNKEVTLIVRDKRLFCKTDNAVADGTRLGSQTALPMNKQIRIGRLSLVITRVET